MSRRKRRESFREFVVIGAIFAALGLLVVIAGRCNDADSRFERDREHRANCVEAERSLGDGIYQERPDCREVLRTQ